MDKLIALYSGLLRLAKLQTPEGLGFPCIATFRFERHNHADALAAIRSARKKQPWQYAGKNYQVTGAKINDKYLEIHGYPLDGPVRII
jgi:hypothetical protein